MAKKKLDISKLAARLGELNKPRESGEGTGVSFINIKDGRNQVRLLPGKEDPTEFYEECWVHYGVGKSGSNKGTFVVCPTTTNEHAKCPQCELSKELKALSKKKDDNYDKQAKQAYRKKRVYFNAIDRADDLTSFVKDDEGNWLNAEGEKESPIKVLGTGIGVFKDILGLLTDPEYGEAILDPEDGLDLIITKTGSGQFNTEYKVTATRKEVPLDFDAWEENLNDLSALVVPKTYDDIATIMDGGDPSSSTEDEDEDEDKGGAVDISDPDYDKSDDKEEDDLKDDIQAALARRRKGK